MSSNMLFKLCLKYAPFPISEIKQIRQIQEMSSSVMIKIFTAHNIGTLSISWHRMLVVYPMSLPPTPLVLDCRYAYIALPLSRYIFQFPQFPKYIVIFCILLTPPPSALLYLCKPSFLFKKQFVPSTVAFCPVSAFPRLSRAEQNAINFPPEQPLYPYRTFTVPLHNLHSPLTEPSQSPYRTFTVLLQNLPSPHTEPHQSLYRTPTVPLHNLLSPPTVGALRNLHSLPTEPPQSPYRTFIVPLQNLHSPPTEP